MRGHPVAVAHISELQEEGATKTFLVRDASGYLYEGFVVRYCGQLRAYVNRCPHVQLSLDYGDGEFFDGDKQFLICRNHGAVFDPATGRCLAGPCAGAQLQTLTLKTEGEVILVEPPPPDPELE